MRLIRTSVVVLASVLAASSASAQTSPVSIQFQNGNVTVRTTARTPLRTVLQEWARVGKARIVNADGVNVTLDQIELVNVPERQALATLLRDISGYAVGMREVASTGPSQFDRIMLLPRSVGTNSGPRPTSVASTAPPPPIAFVAGDPDDDPNPAVRRLPAAAQQGLTNAAVAAARDAAATAAQNSDRNPSEDAQRPGPAANTPANPFFSGPSGRPGQIAPAPPQQQRNPLRPNGDPEP
jgi:hypothetical protein